MQLGKKDDKFLFGVKGNHIARDGVYLKILDMLITLLLDYKCNDTSKIILFD